MKYNILPNIEIEINLILSGDIELTKSKVKKINYEEVRMERVRHSYSIFHGILLIPLIIIYILFAPQTGQTQNAQPIQQDQRTWAIYGSIVTEEGAKEGWLLL